MTKMKLSDYWAPTPVTMRRLGDAFLGISTMSGVPAVVMDYKWTGLSIFVLGIIGKFLTNFFKEIETQTNQNNNGTETETQNPD